MKKKERRENACGFSVLCVSKCFSSPEIPIEKLSLEQQNIREKKIKISALKNFQILVLSWSFFPRSFSNNIATRAYQTCDDANILFTFSDFFQFYRWADLQFSQSSIDGIKLTNFSFFEQIEFIGKVLLNTKTLNMNDNQNQNS